MPGPVFVKVHGSPSEPNPWRDSSASACAVLLHPLHRRWRSSGQLRGLPDAEALTKQLPDLVVLDLIHRPAAVHTALLGKTKPPTPSISKEEMPN